MMRPPGHCPGFVTTLENDAAATPRVERAAWSEGFNEMFALIAGEFLQAQSRWRARGYLLGLLSHAERKNGWTIAEFAGDSSPDGMQRLLNFYLWDVGRVRDALTRYVVASFGHPAAVLVADETGFLKKGRKSAGVARQYTATAGRVRTARSECSWPMPRRTGRGRWSTASCICRRSRAPTRTAALRPAFPMTPSSRPSRS
jgi:DDE superfamily endonuclease